MKNSHIRHKMRRKRLQLPQKKLVRNSLRITQNLLQLPFFTKAKIVASFHSQQGEPLTDLINQRALSMNKMVLFPIVRNFTSRMNFGDNNAGQCLNKFNILEPVKAKKIPLWLFDLVLVPLTAFDNKGNRLGMGKGYYDASFDFATRTKNRPLLIGIAHSFQKVDKITSHKYDVPLDGVVTEKNFKMFKSC